MTTDWAADVKKYVSNADEKVIAGIVRYCGIALQKGIRRWYPSPTRRKSRACAKIS